MKPLFFASPAEWRRWLAANHALEDEVLVGFYKRGSGLPSITWPESVDEALCFGWIDGVRRSVDAERYTIRFTPRRARSTWSAVNVKRVAELSRLGRMRPSGVTAYKARTPGNTAIYSFEQRKTSRLAAADQRRFRANADAWRFFTAQAPWYQRTSIFWVVSAKREETRQKRLTILISDSAAGRRIGLLTSKRTPSVP